MVYVIFMTMGCMSCLLGLTSFVGGSVGGGIFFIVVGISVLALFYKKWKKWYDKKNQALNDIKEMETRRTTPVSAKIVGSDSKTSTGSAAGRAIVGNAVAGLGGAVVGAATAKNTNMTKFLVTYADGHKAIETVKDNSGRFNLLISMLEE